MRKSRRITAKTHENHDKTYLSLLVFMLLFGLVMIHNATVIYSQGLFGGAYRFVFLQLGWILVGSLGFLFFYKFDYRSIYKIAYPLIFFTLIPLGILALIGTAGKLGILECGDTIIFTPCINGAYRWIYLNPPPLPKIPLVGVLGFQPSELAKFSLILYLAVQIDKTIKERKAFSVYIITAALVSGLIILQPNMSTAALIFLIASVMYFSSGAPIGPQILSLPIIGALGIVFMLTSDYRRARLMTLLGLGAEESELTMGYHIKQILIALGSGGIFGVGFGQSRQKFQYLPEVASDSIFAIIGEEMGFLGTTFVVLMFGFFIYKGLSIAKNSNDLLGKLLAVGITAWIGLQAFVNIAAMTKLIPLTGMPLPLISYGGSSMIFSLVGLGVLGNIGKQSSKSRL
jgi:cell division protein FtsW